MIDYDNQNDISTMQKQDFYVIFYQWFQSICDFLGIDNKNDKKNQDSDKCTLNFQLHYLNRWNTILSWKIYWISITIVCWNYRWESALQSILLH